MAMEAAFIMPIQKLEPIKDITAVREVPGVNGEASIFKSVFDSVLNQVRVTQADVENKQYLLATGQLDDAHSLPIAEAKAALSLDVLISLRNKAMESYNELIKINV